MLNLGEHIGSPLQLIALLFVGTDLCVCPNMDFIIERRDYDRKRKISWGNGI